MRVQPAAVNSLLLSQKSDEAGRTARPKAALLVKAVLSRRPGFQETAVALEATTPQVFGVDKESQEIDPVPTKEETGQDCDPEYDPDEEDEEADIGILSCGTDRTCVQDEHSSLGGICVPSNSREDRRLYDDDVIFSAYCSSNPPAGDLDCTFDCSQFDTTSGRGVITCTSNQPYCFGLYMGELLCASYVITYDNQDSAAYPFLGACYDFTVAGNGNAPYDYLCGGYVDSATLGGGTCQFSVNNVDCTCQRVVCPSGTDDGSIINCPGSVSGNTCDGFNFFAWLENVAPVAPGTTLPPFSSPGPPTPSPAGAPRPRQPSSSPPTNRVMSQVATAAAVGFVTVWLW